MITSMLLGYHLVAEGSGIRREPGLVGLFLAHAIEETGLSPISDPVVDEDRGIGFVLIAESHVSIHLKGTAAFADIFSCRRFDHRRALRTARSVFGGTWRGQLLRRDGR